MKTPIWKPIVIIAVLVACFIAMYPPSVKLELGRDLQGGMTLVYQVNLAEDERDPKGTLERIIEVYKKRIDPTGKMDLSWRIQGRDRIEIQMPLASPEIQELRDKYESALDELLSANLDARRVEAALGEGEDAALGLANTDAQKLQIEKLLAAYQEREAAEKAYEEAEFMIKEAQQVLDNLPEDATADERKAAEENIKATRRQNIPAIARAAEAGETFRRELEVLLALNLDPAQVEAALSMPLEPMRMNGVQFLREQWITNAEAQSTLAALLDEIETKIGAGEVISQREAAIQRLIIRFPDREDLIRKTADSFAEYDDKRGAFDDPEIIKRLMKGSGVLEFRIAARPGSVPTESSLRAELAEKGPRDSGNDQFKWIEVDPEGFAETASMREEMMLDPVGFFRERYGMVGARYGNGAFVLLGNSDSNSITANQKGWKLSASPGADQYMFPAVNFSMNAVGANLMGNLTGAHRGQQMVIVLDGRAISAPTVNDKITSSGIITGGKSGFSQQEQQYLVRTLNAGDIAASVVQEPIMEMTTSPQFGADNLRAGLESSLDALIIVAIFMAIYYFFWGAVADFALFANMVVILGVIAAMRATFTLPGIAGIVLTIGMAVDANVLIFERIREEMENDVDLRTAIRIGYEKALSTIIDANLTTLITCVVLFYTATTEIKGFAQVLMVGVLATMFTALFCTRVIIDIFVDVTNIKKLGMLSTVFPAIRRVTSPNIDWVGKRYIFFTISAIFMAGGLVVLVSRGADTLDIEFRGGTQVGFKLEEGKTLEIAEVRERLDTAAEKYELPDLAGDRAAVVEIGTNSDEFSIATTHTNEERDIVVKAIKDVFGEYLETTQPIDFSDMGKELAVAPLYRITGNDLSQVINRSVSQGNEIADFRGGVAIVVEGMEPAVTPEELEERLDRMNNQPPYNEMGYRNRRLVPLGSPDADGRYTSYAWLAGSSGTNYIENPNTLMDADGLAATEWKLINEALQFDSSLANVTNLSSQVSGEMARTAIVAMVLSLLAVVIYIWFRFGSMSYGIAAIIALVHDVSIALGALAISGLLADSMLGKAILVNDFKINLAIVAALLTIVGYSLNDTIVIFDRIRENRGRLSYASPETINRSINQTISRTLLTSGTTMLAVLVLYIFGGVGVHGFAFAMIIGVFIGTYSSIAIAAPVLLLTGGGTPKAEGGELVKSGSHLSRTTKKPEPVGAA